MTSKDLKKDGSRSNGINVYGLDAAMPTVYKGERDNLVDFSNI